MSREEYIHSNITKLFHFWSNIAIVSGGLFIIALGLLDFFATPSNFKTFLIYRIITAACFFIIFYFNRPMNEKLNVILFVAVSVIVSTMVALMIAKFGGHQSPYYVGFIITTVYVLGFVPFRFKTSIFTSLIIYGIYVVPIIIYDDISNKAFFISANGFILAVIFIALLIRYLNQQRLVNELGLQYDLDRQSKQLEELVEERTTELKISEQWHKTIFEGANDSILILSRDGGIENVNNRFTEMYGYTKDYVNNAHYSLIETNRSQKELNELIDRLLNGETLIYESVHRKNSGDKLDVEVSAKAVEVDGDMHVQLFVRDITKLKKLREQLLHAQKMESIGTLTGGIAHDFNNILTVILGYVELIKQSTESLPKEMAEWMGVVENSARKATQLVAKLLKFARKDVTEKTPINFNALVKDSLKMLSRLIDRSIVMEESLDSSIPPIEADANQLEQVIINLVINAKDAMPDGGNLYLKTKLIELKKSSLPVPDDLEEGKYIHFSVTDTGVGIPADEVDKIFDPFYTTKREGEGSGLGLAMIYGIVKEHGGGIKVESAPDKGSSFHIFLPAIKPLPKAPEEDDVVSLFGGENILLIEDERPVLDMTKNMLSKYGYNVLATDSPVNGVKIYGTMHDKIDLVITDMIMPDMNGKRVIEEIRKINPGVKVIVFSGYTDQILQGSKIRIDGFIKKPFEIFQILSSIRRVLDANKPVSYQ